MPQITIAFECDRLTDEQWAIILNDCQQAVLNSTAIRVREFGLQYEPGLPARLAIRLIEDADELVESGPYADYDPEYDDEGED